jgi:chromosome segregation ATPase
MMGSSSVLDPDSPTVGLIPRISREMFDRIARRQANAPKGTKFKHTLTASYLEIYCEKIRDLFSDTLEPSSNTKGLKVREHPVDGVCVPGLTAVNVASYADVERLLVAGNHMRTVAETKMNEASSRSHAIFTLRFSETSLEKTTGTAIAETTSKVVLVDLAGSERADTLTVAGRAAQIAAERASRPDGDDRRPLSVSEAAALAARAKADALQRHKEMTKINTSLSALGAVIKALSSHGQSMSTGGTGVNFVPYRNSVLTWLLKDTLGGNSATTMIATVSPADANYAETLSTLKYCESVKCIVNTVSRNADQPIAADAETTLRAQAAMVQQLQAEVAQLRAQLTSKSRVSYVPSTMAQLTDRSGGADPDSAPLEDLQTIVGQRFGGRPSMASENNDEMRSIPGHRIAEAMMVHVEDLQEAIRARETSLHRLLAECADYSAGVSLGDASADLPEGVCHVFVALCREESLHGRSGLVFPAGLARVTLSEAPHDGLPLHVVATASENHSNSLCRIMTTVSSMHLQPSADYPECHVLLNGHPLDPETDMAITTGDVIAFVIGSSVAVFEARVCTTDSINQYDAVSGAVVFSHGVAAASWSDAEHALASYLYMTQKSLIALADVQNLRDQVLHLASENIRLGAQLTSSNSRVKELEGQIDDATTTATEKSAAAAAALLAQEDALRQLGEREADNAELHRQLESLSAQLKQEHLLRKQGQTTVKEMEMKLQDQNNQHAVAASQWLNNELKLQEQIAGLQQQIVEYQDKDASSASQIISLQSGLASAHNDIRDLQGRLAAVLLEKDNTTTELNRSKAAHSILELQLEGSQAEVAELRTALLSAENAAENQDEAMHQLRSQYDQLKAHNADVLAQLKAALADVSKLNATCANQTKTIHAHEATIKAQTTEIANLQEISEQHKQLAAQACEILEKTSAEVAELRAALDSTHATVVQLEEAMHEQEGQLAETQELLADSARQNVRQAESLQTARESFETLNTASKEFERASVGNINAFVQKWLVLLSVQMERVTTATTFLTTLKTEHVTVFTVLTQLASSLGLQVDSRASLAELAAVLAEGVKQHVGQLNADKTELAGLLKAATISTAALQQQLQELQQTAAADTAALNAQLEHVRAQSTLRTTQLVEQLTHIHASVSELQQEKHNLVQCMHALQTSVNTDATESSTACCSLFNKQHAEQVHALELARGDAEDWEKEANALQEMHAKLMSEYNALTSALLEREKELELRTAELAASSAELHVTQNSLEEISTAKETLAAEKDVLATQHATTAAELAATQVELAARNEELVAVQSQRNGLQNIATALKHSKEELLAEAAAHKATIAKLEADLEKAQEELAAARAHAVATDEGISCAFLSLLSAFEHADAIPGLEQAMQLPQLAPHAQPLVANLQALHELNGHHWELMGRCKVLENEKLLLEEEIQSLNHASVVAATEQAASMAKLSDIKQALEVRGAALAREFSSLRNDVSALREERAQLVANMQTLQVSLTADFSSISTSVTTHIHEVHLQHSEIKERLEEDLSSHQSKASVLADKHARLQEDHSALQSQHATAAEDNAALTAALSERVQSLDVLSKQHEELEARLNGDIAALQGIVANLEGKVTDMSANIHSVMKQQLVAFQDVKGIDGLSFAMSGPDSTFAPYAAGVANHIQAFHALRAQYDSQVQQYAALEQRKAQLENTSSSHLDSVKQGIHARNEVLAHEAAVMRNECQQLREQRGVLVSAVKSLQLSLSADFTSIATTVTTHIQELHVHHTSTLLQLQSTASAAQGDVEALLEKQKAIEHLTSSLMNERDALTTALGERTAALETLQQQHAQAEATILRLESEVVALQSASADLQSRLNDVTTSVSDVMDKKLAALEDPAAIEHLYASMQAAPVFTQYTADVTDRLTALHAIVRQYATVEERNASLTQDNEQLQSEGAALAATIEQLHAAWNAATATAVKEQTSFKAQLTSIKQALTRRNAASAHELAVIRLRCEALKRERVELLGLVGSLQTTLTTYLTSLGSKVNTAVHNLHIEHTAALTETQNSLAASEQQVETTASKYAALHQDHSALVADHTATTDSLRETKKKYAALEKHQQSVLSENTRLSAELTAIQAAAAHQDEQLEAMHAAVSSVMQHQLLAFQDPNAVDALEESMRAFPAFAAFATDVADRVYALHTMKQDCMKLLDDFNAKNAEVVEQNCRLTQANNALSQELDDERMAHTLTAEATARLEHELVEMGQQRDGLAAELQATTENAAAFEEAAHQTNEQAVVAVHNAAAEIAKLRAHIEVLEASVEGSGKEASQLQAQLAELKQTVATLTQQNTVLQRSNEQQRQVLSNTEQEVGVMAASMRSLESDVATLQQAMQQNTAEKERLRQELYTNTTSIESLTTSFASITTISQLVQRAVSFAEQHNAIHACRALQRLAPLTIHIGTQTSETLAPSPPVIPSPVIRGTSLSITDETAGRRSARSPLSSRSLEAPAQLEAAVKVDATVLQPLPRLSPTLIRQASLRRVTEGIVEPATHSTLPSGLSARLADLTSSSRPPLASARSSASLVTRVPSSTALPAVAPSSIAAAVSPTSSLTSDQPVTLFDDDSSTELSPRSVLVNVATRRASLSAGTAAVPTPAPAPVPAPAITSPTASVSSATGGRRGSTTGIVRTTGVQQGFVRRYGAPSQKQTVATTRFELPEAANTSAGPTNVARMSEHEHDASHKEYVVTQQVAPVNAFSSQRRLSVPTALPAISLVVSPTSGQVIGFDTVKTAPHPLGSPGGQVRAVTQVAGSPASPYDEDDNDSPPPPPPASPSPKDGAAEMELHSFGKPNPTLSRVLAVSRPSFSGSVGAQPSPIGAPTITSPAATAQLGTVTSQRSSAGTPASSWTRAAPSLDGYFFSPTTFPVSPALTSPPPSASSTGQPTIRSDSASTNILQRELARLRSASNVLASRTSEADMAADSLRRTLSIQSSNTSATSYTEGSVRTITTTTNTTSAAVRGSLQFTSNNSTSS